MMKMRGIPLLHIAIVIVGAALLATLGQPVWHRYSIEQHIADAVGDAAGTKLVVMEAATVLGGFSQVRAGDLQYNAGVSAGEYVSKVEVADGGLITVRTRNTGAVPDPVIVLIPAEGSSTGAPITWSCQVFIGDTSQAPPDCRGNARATVSTEESKPAALSLAL
jgi:type IV pilus assembly protein PilA